jgi:crotonobetainyl-CoA:carnitine CoA-transferase CaiB-like acyl-CoA transferase
LYDAQDLLNDAHIKARGDIVWIKDSRGKDFPMPAPLPHIESMPGAVKSLGPFPGEGQDEVLLQFGFKREHIDKFKDIGVLWA